LLLSGTARAYLKLLGCGYFGTTLQKAGYKAASLQYRRLKLLLTRLEKLSQIILRNQAKKGIQAPAVNLRGLNALKQAYLSSTFKVAF